MAINNLQPIAYIVVSLAFAVGTSSIFLRLYCRAILLRTFGWDDVAAVFLLLVNTMQQTILYIFLHYGCGLHAAALNKSQIYNIQKWLIVEEIFYMFTHWTIKTSFLFFYLRLSPDLTFRRLVYATMALNTMVTITNWLLALLQCIPFEAILHPADYPHAKCIEADIVLMLPSGLNIITDLAILFLPIPTVLSLQMPFRRKMAVLGVIGFGASAVIVALCRFVVLKELGSSDDISYVLGNMVIVAALEIQSAVVAVNLPAMKALFSRVIDFSGYSGGSAGYKLSENPHHSGADLANGRNHSSAVLGGSNSKGSHNRSANRRLRKSITGMAERDLITTVNETMNGSEEDLIEGQQHPGKIDGIRVATTVDVDNTLRQPGDAHLYGKLVSPYKSWKKDERA
ncbi:conserved hypothetical protein [Talaromyces stipitatus ATCC 10500]|uniref:Rhodopsin domain-containing protein n=1 Tax=Talaromyces stipitatus (strain ATCC 10500 / CBS 375.48 / QM 6759 / NRRL 1006) TaxID=441959 RepID=B8MGD2_TALSN|nr:uncharacterized protein TSTA_013520 [Talaromyces stipitatus ATCC 10500]EED16252.1 conserved hypothetical protein [Talaromyces stipitatus ATCC 10500]